MLVKLEKKGKKKKKMRKEYCSSLESFPSLSQLVGPVTLTSVELAETVNINQRRKIPLLKFLPWKASHQSTLRVDRVSFDLKR